MNCGYLGGCTSNISLLVVSLVPAKKILGVHLDVDFRNVDLELGCRNVWSSCLEINCWSAGISREICCQTVCGKHEIGLSLGSDLLNVSRSGLGILELGCRSCEENHDNDSYSSDNRSSVSNHVGNGKEKRTEVSSYCFRSVFQAEMANLSTSVTPRTQAWYGCTAITLRSELRERWAT